MRMRTRPSGSAMREKLCSCKHDDEEAVQMQNSSHEYILTTASETCVWTAVPSIQIYTPSDAQCTRVKGTSIILYYCCGYMTLSSYGVVSFTFV